MARRVPVKTALVGLLFAPGAMAQQPPDQNAQAPDPTPPPSENKPADPNAAPATMQPVTVTGSRPSEDFQTTKTSINRLGAADLMDVPQSVVVINKALMESQGATSGRSKVDFPINYDGKAMSIGFNPDYLVEMLKVLPPDA